MNWQLTIQVFGIIVGASISIYQIQHLLPASRTTLKADLEILKLLDKDDPAFVRVKAHVDRAVDRTYPPMLSDVDQSHSISWGILVFFLVTGAGLVTWTIYLSHDGFNAWALLTGVFALVAIFGIIGVLVPESTKQRTRTDTKRNNVAHSE